MISDPPSWATYFSCEETNPGRYAGELEVRHILMVASFDWERLWQMSISCPLKGNLANNLFFVPLLPQLQPALTNETTTVQRYVLTWPIDCNLASSLQR